MNYSAKKCQEQNSKQSLCRLTARWDDRWGIHFVPVAQCGKSDIREEKEQKCRQSARPCPEPPGAEWRQQAGKGATHPVQWGRKPTRDYQESEELLRANSAEVSGFTNNSSLADSRFSEWRRRRLDSHAPGVQEKPLAGSACNYADLYTNKMVLVR